MPRKKLAPFCIWLLLLSNFIDLTNEQGIIESLPVPHRENSLVKIVNAHAELTQRPVVKSTSCIEENVSLCQKFSTTSTTTTTLVAACKERLLQLQQVFNSWLSIYCLCEIVLVDWSSTASLQSFVLDAIQSTSSSLQVVIVRVENATNWNLAQAYNLAASFSTKDWILKADCDTWIDPWFLSRHPRINHTFYSASKATERHLHGVFYMPREVFYQIGGFDERIQSYGWEDDSLLERAMKYLYLEPIQANTVAHIPHDDTLRQKYQRCLLGTDCLPELEIQFNRILFSKFLPTWNANNLLHSEYSIVECNISKPTSMIRLWPKKLVPTPSISPFHTELAKTKAIRIILVNKYYFPRNSVRMWSFILLERVIRELIRRKPFLLIICSFTQYEMALLENLSTKYNNNNNSNRLVMFLANTTCQFSQALQKGFPVLYWNDTKLTDLFQNPHGSYCLPYRMISNRTFHVSLRNTDWFPYDHWILSTVNAT